MSQMTNTNTGTAQTTKIRLGRRIVTRQDIQDEQEANESIRAINDFENKIQKMPNKYPKISLDKHLKLDSVMKERVKGRMQVH